jgi:hypothetical protein
MAAGVAGAELRRADAKGQALTNAERERVGRLRSGGRGAHQQGREKLGKATRCVRTTEIVHSGMRSVGVPVRLSLD